jgi:hypothetical protein
VRRAGRAGSPYQSKPDLHRALACLRDASWIVAAIDCRCVQPKLAGPQQRSSWVEDSVLTWHRLVATVGAGRPGLLSWRLRRILNGSLQATRSVRGCLRPPGHGHQAGGRSTSCITAGMLRPRSARIGRRGCRPTAAISGEADRGRRGAHKPGRSGSCQFRRPRQQAHMAPYRSERFMKRSGREGHRLKPTRRPGNRTVTASR